jgi:predicted nucleic acid-binding protein
MPKVIANTSPIQYLFQVGLLDLLPSLYGRIFVPPAVRDELDRGKALGIALPDLDGFEWVSLAAPETRVLLPLASGLGVGELQVIALAKETAEHLALLDDRRARRFARLLGLTYSGTLGVLLKAKQQGILERLAPVCDALEQRGFRLSPRTRQSVLSRAGE